MMKTWNRKKMPIYTEIPGYPAIELIEYYEEFRDYYSRCEMATKNWFIQNIDKGWHIIDCGANIGYFSILFAKLATEGHVYAFEPTSTYDMLVKNLKHHKLKNVTSFKIAVGKKSMDQEENIFRIWGEEPERQVYSFTTIDDFVHEHNLSRLDCIKIDVDSFDFEVLQGAKDVLVKFDPYVMVELNHALNKRGQSNTQAIEWLAALGYNEALVLDYDNFLLKRNPMVNRNNNASLYMKLFF